MNLQNKISHKFLFAVLLFIGFVLAGEQDSIGYNYQESGVDVLYSPWRDSYNYSQQPKQVGCPFCRHFSEEMFEEKNFVLLHSHGIVVLLTMYPYHDGHIIVFPQEHVTHLHELSMQRRCLLMEVVSKTTCILERELGIKAFNVGINIGEASGASIPDHLHVHIVPRKKMDIGFIQIIGQVKHIKNDLDRVYSQLKPAFEEEFLEAF